MAKGYAKSTATLTAATAISVAALLAAEGYTGSMVGKYLSVEDTLGDLFRGADSSVTNLTGIPFVADVPYIRRGKRGLAVDPAGVWLYSATGGDISLTFEPF